MDFSCSSSWYKWWGSGCIIFGMHSQNQRWRWQHTEQWTSKGNQESTLTFLCILNAAIFWEVKALLWGYRGVHAEFPSPHKFLDSRVLLSVIQRLNGGQCFLSESCFCRWHFCFSSSFKNMPRKGKFSFLFPSLWIFWNEFKLTSAHCQDGDLIIRVADIC